MPLKVYSGSLHLYMFPDNHEANRLPFQKSCLLDVPHNQRLGLGIARNQELTGISGYSSGNKPLPSQAVSSGSWS